MEYPSEDHKNVANNSGPIYLGLILVIAFIIGIAIGFLGRPLLLQDLPIEVAVTVVSNSQTQSMTQANQSTLAATTPGSSTATAEGDADDKSSGPTPTIMDFVLSDARHFQGDAAAPVVMVEFSDFK